MSIKAFRGDYRFLSNFWIAPFEYNFGEWGTFKVKTVEHGYQALKARDQKDFLNIIQMSSAKETKIEGKIIKLRKDWDTVKLELMFGLVKAKFESTPFLKQELIATYPERLIEGNTWGDIYWGVDTKLGGENHLGIILMAIREGFIKKECPEMLV
jgi:ribA/ribD-fused uncharacterized protein